MIENKYIELYVYPEIELSKIEGGRGCNAKIYTSWAGTGEQLHVIEHQAVVDLQAEVERLNIRI